MIFMLCNMRMDWLRRHDCAGLGWGPTAEGTPFVAASSQAPSWFRSLQAGNGNERIAWREGPTPLNRLLVGWGAYFHYRLRNCCTGHLFLLPCFSLSPSFSCCFSDKKIDPKKIPSHVFWTWRKKGRKEVHRNVRGIRGEIRDPLADETVREKDSEKGHLNCV